MFFLLLSRKSNKREITTVRLPKGPKPDPCIWRLHSDWSAKGGLELRKLNLLLKFSSAFTLKPVYSVRPLRTSTVTQGTIQVLMIICQMCFTAPPQTSNLTLMHMLKLQYRLHFSHRTRKKKPTDTCLLRFFFFTVWQLGKNFTSYVTISLANKDIVVSE